MFAYYMYKVVQKLEPILILSSNFEAYVSFRLHSACLLQRGGYDFSGNPVRID